MTTQNSLLFHATGVARDLASHLTPCYGPLGKHAIVINDVGKVNITRSGAHILRAHHCADPHARMIVDAVDAHAKQIGDGSKTFVVLLSSILSSVLESLPPDGATNAAIEIQRRRLDLRQALFALRNQSDAILRQWNSFPIKSTTTIHRLLFSFFRTRSIHRRKSAAERLSRLTADLIASTRRSTSPSLKATLDHLIDHFPHIVLNAPGESIEASRISSREVILSRDFDSGQDSRLDAPDVTFSPARVNKLVLLRCSVSELDSCNTTFETLSLDAVSRRFVWRSDRTSKMAGALARAGVTLLLVQDRVAPFELAALAARGIRCVAHLPEDELRWLASVFGRRIIDDPLEVLDGDLKDFVVDFETFKTIVVDGRARVILIFSEGRCREAIFDASQLILASPTLTACEALSFVLSDALKMLRIWLQNEDSICVCGSLWDPLPLLRGSELSKLSNSLSSKTRGLGIISRALSEPLRLIHQNSLSSGKGDDRLVVAMHEMRLLTASGETAGLDARIGRVFCCLTRQEGASTENRDSPPNSANLKSIEVNSRFSEDVDLESGEIKLRTLISATELAVRLLSIDGILRVKGRLKSSVRPRDDYDDDDEDDVNDDEDYS